MNGKTARKLLERMRNSPSGWGQKDFERLFGGFGFKWKEGKKHRVYTHSVFADLVISVPRHNTLKEWVARDSVKLIDELMERSGPRERSQEEDDSDGTDNKNT